MQAKKWLVVLIGFVVIIAGWALSIQAVTGIKERNAQAALITQANDFMEKGLYVRAIPLYEQAINDYSFGNENELQQLLLDAYLGRGDASSYGSLVAKRITAGTATEEEYLTYADNCFRTYDGKTGMKILKQGLENLDSEKIREMYEAHRYEYSIRYTGYEEILPVRSGFAPAFDGENWCYVNSKGQRQGRLYESVTRFNEEGIAVVLYEGKYYAINLFEEKYGIDETGVSDVLGLSNSSILAAEDGKYGFYSYDFVLRSKDLKFDYISGQASDMFAVRDGDKWGLMTTSGEMVAPVGTYEDVAINSIGTAYAYSLAMVKDSNGWYMVNASGERINDKTFSDAKAPESDGYIAVADSSGKWGFADRTGEIVIPCQYDDAMSFSDGLAPVKENGYWHYISIYNATAIDLDLTDANPFHNGVAIAYFGNGESLISLTYYEK